MVVSDGLVFSEGSWGEVSEGLVRAFLIVGGHPLVDDLPHFGEAAEEMGVEHFPTEAAVETLDIGVLSRLVVLPWKLDSL